ncbi:MAG: hypothetical protein HY951_08340 [Bacteroidia bacterium]|nr:hypothetical protein [Bacteroidia bacterium]
MNKFIKKHNFIFLVILVLFFVACSPTTTYKVMSTLFDGVPDPNAKPLIEVKDSIKNDSLALLEAANIQTTGSSVVHEPYKSNDCSNCHNDGSLTMQQPELCYQCHENFNTKYKYLHGPVVSGGCTACHNPHMSDYKKLVLREGQQLCYYCHDSKDVLKNEAHADLGETNCTECHNPHGGEDKYIFK